MPDSYLEMAIRSVMNSRKAFCKFLAANETGATGSHQSGILIPKSAVKMLFSEENIEKEYILKRLVKITWQNDLVTESSFTWYKSKNEFRITRFGRGFPFLNPEQTGALFVLTQQSEDDYSGYFLETEKDIEEFLSTFGIGPTETNNIINTDRLQPEINEKIAIQEFIASLNVDFPTTDVMAFAARSIWERVYSYEERIKMNADQKIIAWTNMEYSLFRALEYARYTGLINKGFDSVDEFIKIANIVLNRRKSRAGTSLQHHLAAVFDENMIQYEAQVVTEIKKKLDFIFPSAKAYHNPSFPSDKLISLAVKTTCKDRWRQVINEANRFRNRPKYLCTLQQGISVSQIDEMQEEGVVLVVPEPYIDKYPVNRKDRIWTLSRFIAYVREIEGR